MQEKIFAHVTFSYRTVKTVQCHFDTVKHSVSVATASAPEESGVLFPLPTCFNYTSVKSTYSALQNVLNSLWILAVGIMDFTSSSIGIRKARVGRAPCYAMRGPTVFANSLRGLGMAKGRSEGPLGGDDSGANGGFASEERTRTCPRTATSYLPEDGFTPLNFNLCPVKPHRGELASVGWTWVKGALTGRCINIYGVFLLNIAFRCYKRFSTRPNFKRNSASETDVVM